LCAAYVYSTWITPALAWGDWSIWLHSIERFAAGETPYVDFYTVYPPLGYWVIGSIARLFGPYLVVLCSATAVVFALICLAFHRYARLVTPSYLLPWVVVAGFVLAVTYSNTHSPPLPVGMHTPAEPLAVLLLLTATVLLLRLVSAGGALTAAALGVCAALGILAKHDVWLPMLYLLVVGAFLLRATGRADGMRLAGTALGAAAATLVVGLGALAAAIGPENLSIAFWPPGQVENNLTRMLPTWERLTVQVAALGAAGVVVGVAMVVAGATRLRDARRTLLLSTIVAGLAIALHLAMSYRAGLAVRAGDVEAFLTPTQEFVNDGAHGTLPLIKHAILWFLERFRLHALPILLPLGVAGLLLARRRHNGGSGLHTLALFLLGLAIVARVRRGFEFVEWFPMLLELPAYALALTLLGRGARDRVLAGARNVLVVVLVFGLWAHWHIGRGLLTDRRPTVPYESARGTVHVGKGAAETLAWVAETLDAADPGGERPLFTYGYTAGFSYLTGRPNPTPLVLGFALSHVPVDEALQQVRALSPPPFLMHTNVFDRNAMPVGGLDPGRWDQRMGRNYVAEIDGPPFAELLESCERIAFRGKSEDPFLSIWDCSFSD
jgi:hypothetical protein